jgi:sirohydrochlorin ferrochelatase
MGAAREDQDDVVAVIIVDHGSRRTAANTAFVEFVQTWRGQLPYPIVEPAHMELAEPSIGTAFDRCVDAGATTVAVAPWFLGPGNHWDRDIPALVAESGVRHPDVRWLVAAPLGPDPLLLELVDRRVSRCLSHVAGQTEECSACTGSGRCRLRKGMG